MKSLFLITSFIIGSFCALCQQLEIEGAIRIANSVDTTPPAGTIQWTGSKFEGYNGRQWQSFGVISYFLTLPHGIQTLLDAGESINNIMAAGATPDDFLTLRYHDGFIFELVASLRNTYADRWAVCQSAQIYIIGTGGAMIIPLAKIGCSSANNLMLNDVFLRGPEHDLSAFGVDLSNFGVVRISNQDRNMKFYINDNLVYKSRYQQSMGWVVGLRFKFLGAGEVREIVLRDALGNQITL